MMYKKKYDYHLHSCFSSDCNSALEDIVAAAKNKGLSSICLTDHNDLDFPDNPDNLSFDLDIDTYIDTLTRLRESLLPDFDLRIGVEQGVMPSTCDALNDYSTAHPGIDFIICSSHVVNGSDPYYSECFTNPDGTPIDVMDIYREYYENILYNVCHFSDYNVYGHIDYIFRYGPDRVTGSTFMDKYYPVLKDIIYEILKTIIASGKGIEINTGSLYRGMDYMHPHISILKMYSELGGEILTIGSDAHDLEHIGYGYDEAIELAKEAGLRYVCTFKDMKPKFHRIYI